MSVAPASTTPLAVACTLAGSFAEAAIWGPDRSILVATVGLLLIYLECNRPGRVLPGAAGLLFLLLGLHSLGRSPLRPGAALLVALAILLLALPLRLRLLWSALLPGTALLSFSLATLSARGHLSTAAGACGLLLGPVTAWLASVAGQARRAKRNLKPAHAHSHLTTSPDSWE